MRQRTFGDVVEVGPQEDIGGTAPSDVVDHTIELDPVKLEPLDLLPVLGLDDELVLPEALAPVPGPLFDDDEGASLCVHAPSAR